MRKNKVATTEMATATATTKNHDDADLASAVGLTEEFVKELIS